jgi:hypothetical protein
MTQAHKGSRLLIKDQSIPVDFSTIHFSYSQDAVGIQYGDLLFPSGNSVYTIRENEGKFGGTVAVEGATTNQLTNPENLSATEWGKSAITVNYANSESALIPTAVNASHYLMQDSSLISGSSYTHSVTARAGQYSVLQIAPSTGFGNSSTYSNFDLINGTVSGTAGGQIAYVGGGYYRCEVTSTASLTISGRMVFGPVPNMSSLRLASFSGNGSDCIYIKNVQLEKKPFSTSYVNGSRGNGYLQYPNVQINTNFTLSAWVYYEEPTPFTFYHKNCLLYLDDPVDYLSGNSFRFFPRGNEVSPSNPRIAFWASNPATWYYGNTTLQQKTWYHVAYIYNGTSMKIYINGNLDATVAVSKTMNKESKILVGGKDTDEWANGMINDLAIFPDRTLTDEEIYAIYISDSPLYNPYDYRAYSY